MKKDMRYVGLDVHGESIAVAVVESDGTGESLGTIANRPESIRKKLKKLGDPAKLVACYEAGPTGYVLYWQLVELGVKCQVVAPTLIPTKAGDRVKTDRRDAMKLARYLRSGDLTPVWVPDRAHEGMRDLVRARQAAKKDEKRARNRMTKFLLRHGKRPPEGVRAWSAKWWLWVEALKFEQPTQQVVLTDYLHQVRHEQQRVLQLEKAIDEAIEQAPDEIRAVVAALQTLRGVAKVTAVGVVAEVGQFSRFEHPHQLMGYSGQVPSEFSTGGPGKHRRGPITKTGNAHLRRLLGEAAWSYQHRPAVRYPLRKRQKDIAPEINAISWKAQQRLCGRFRRLVSRGMVKQKVVTAVGRELLGFMWAIGIHTEQQNAASSGAAAAL
jgi:transposase